MSHAAARHDDQHLESVFMHALQALPATESRQVEAQIAECAECGREMQALRPIVSAFVSWPIDVLRPSRSLWDRLAQRIADETGSAPMSPAPAPRPTQPEWFDAAPGISCRVLATDTEKNRVSMLVRLAPGTDYPPHRHADVEELHLLHGVLIVDEKTLYPGDYLRSEPGTVDHRVWSETGCTCVLLTSIDDIIL
jgi:quercetin dioxygenase-like cupin family protein